MVKTRWNNMVVRLLDVWRLGESTWRVVGRGQDDLWLLSGPGPCRGLRTLDTDSILAGELIERAESVEANGV